MSRARTVSATGRMLGVWCGIFLLFLYLPVLLLPLFSLSLSPLVAFPITGFTVRWYVALFRDPACGQALLASLQVALVVSPVATMAGLLAAYALVRRRARTARLAASLSLAPLLIPGVVLGVAMLVTATLLGLSPSLPVVALGQAVLCLPLSLVILRNHFLATSANVEDAARDLGAGPWRVLLWVVIPMAWPSLLSSLVLCFTTAMDEFVVSYFLAGTRPTLPIFIWTHLRFPLELPRMMALGTLLLLASSALALTGERLAMRRRRDA